jgi:ubiquinone/menaquinone biosynthesis C-methylase UbiE
MMTIADRVSFRMMSFVHEDMYKVFRDPYKVLKAAGLKPGQEVLEVGCGPGFFTIPAARIVGEEGRVDAMDINTLALERVRQKLEQEGVTNVRTMLADASQTAFPDESFDLIFLFGLGRAIGGTDRIMAELHRLLRPGGTLSIEGRQRPPSGLFQQEKGQGRMARFRKARQETEPVCRPG